MPQIIAIHSFRRGTGKSSLAVNLATLWATEGQRVGLMDLNFNAPSLHILLGLQSKDLAYTINGYLLNQHQIEQAALDISEMLPSVSGGNGRLFLIPGDARRTEIKCFIETGYDSDLLGQGFYDLLNRLSLDVLLLDTAAGLNEESLVSLTFADKSVIVLRLDKQDYQGTAITIQLLKQLENVQPYLVVNAALTSFDFIAAKIQVEAAYDCQVAAVLPYAKEFTALYGTGIFAIHYSYHPLTRSLKILADKLL